MWQQFLEFKGATETELLPPGLSVVGRVAVGNCGKKMWEREGSKRVVICDVSVRPVPASPSWTLKPRMVVGWKIKPKSQERGGFFFFFLNYFLI